jgi:hypothetical protein
MTIRWPMTWKPLLLASAALFSGAGALPASDCRAPPAPAGTALEEFEPSALDVIGPLAPPPPTEARPASVGCLAMAAWVLLPGAALRNDRVDILYGLQPAEQLHSPLDVAPPSYR